MAKLNWGQLWAVGGFQQAVHRLPSPLCKGLALDCTLRYGGCKISRFRRRWEGRVSPGWYPQLGWDGGSSPLLNLRETRGAFPIPAFSLQAKKYKSFCPGYRS